METVEPHAAPTNRDKTLFRLVDANIIAVATCDADGRILEANDAYLDMLGYIRDELVSGQIAWQELTPPEWNDVSMKAVAEIQAGRVVEWVGTIVDVTERKTAEEERERVRGLESEREAARG